MVSTGNDITHMRLGSVTVDARLFIDEFLNETRGGDDNGGSRPYFKRVHFSIFLGPFGESENRMSICYERLNCVLT